MKKNLLISLLVSLALTNLAFAAPSKAKSDQSCKTAMEYMKQSHQEIKAAIDANDTNKVGELVIARHKYIMDFKAKNSACKHMKQMKHCKCMQD